MPIIPQFKGRGEVKGPETGNLRTTGLDKMRSVDLHHQHHWELVRKHKLSGPIPHTPTKVESGGAGPRTMHC